MSRERGGSSSLLAHLPQPHFSVLDAGLLLYSSLTKWKLYICKPYQQSRHTVTDSLIREMPAKPLDELWQHFFLLLLCLVRLSHRYQRTHRRRRSRRCSAGTPLCRHTRSHPHNWCRIGSSRTLQSRTRPALKGRGSSFSPWTRSELLPQFCSGATALFSTCLSLSPFSSPT